MEKSGPAYGLIRLFVRHPTASNLLMTIMIVLGLFGLQRLNTQFFPTIEIPMITVSIAWPGASAEDVEKNILDAVEPELRFVDGVEKAISVAREGAGVITLEFVANADMQKALSDIEQGVNSITTLPQDSEEPVIKRITFYEPVANISVSGPFSEATIKDYAKNLRDGLLAAGIDKVTLTGAREEEIWVQIREFDLRRLNITLGDIAQKIKLNSRDLPSGTVEGDIEVQLRALGDRKTPDAIGNIEIKSDKAGNKILLRDVATVKTRFDEDAKIGMRHGEPAIELTVSRAVSADTLKTMELMEQYLEKILPTLPPTLKVAKYNVRGKFVRQRLGILVKNGLQGLVLVLLILFIFLNVRIAFWVAAGIPVALLATLVVMLATGQSINMISMFALIMMLGIIVDDAIVVGEHTATRREMGDTRLEAAERGAMRMFSPVLAATLTTQAAFLPILLVGDRIGDIMSAIPLVVMAVLTASVIECFLILPGHLRHGMGAEGSKPSRFRQKFDNTLAAFTKGPYRRFVELTYHWRYATIAMTIASLIICFGFIVGGRVGFNFFPSPEPENISAKIVFAAGLPREDQMKILARVDKTLYDVEKKLAPKGEKLIVSSFTTLGQLGRSSGDNLAEISVQLTASEERTVPTRKVLGAWRRNVPKFQGVDRIVLVTQRVGPPGRDIDVRLEDAPVDILKKAAEELKVALTKFPGLSGIEDDLPYGKQELIMELTPRGTALGFTIDDIGAQIRNAFEGAIATRFARDDEEITVRVKRVQEVSGIHALQQIYLRSSSGARVPLSEIVSLRAKDGFSVIQRIDGVRTVSVTADLDAKVADNQTIVDELNKSVLPQLAERYGLRYSFSGRAEERAKSFADLKTGALVSLILIYIILAWVFESYFKPFAVLAIIPFGIVGAIFGHYVMGFSLSIISMIGLLGLSGILVNDSIILVSQVKSRLDIGNNLEEAAIGASQDRLRAVILTSLTTIGGLLPLLFETSRQAQFLIPMAITMVFGLAAATILVLVLVPALVGVGGDFKMLLNRLGRLYGFNWGADDNQNKPKAETKITQDAAGPSLPAAGE